MRLLLDTNILVAIARDRLGVLGAPIASAVASPENEAYASVASLWEVAIKTRLGKLDPRLPLESLSEQFQAARLNMISIDDRHAITEAKLAQPRAIPSTASFSPNAPSRACAW